MEESFDLASSMALPMDATPDPEEVFAYKYLNLTDEQKTIIFQDITSPPYNLNKCYEVMQKLKNTDYESWIIKQDQLIALSEKK